MHAQNICTTAYNQNNTDRDVKQTFQL